MTVKVMLLKSGEDVISDAKEILDKQERGIIAYHLNNPYIMQILEKQEDSDQLVTDDSNEAKPKSTFQVQYVNWAPLSKQREFIIPSDWVVTIYDPHDQIMKDYCAKHSIEIEEDGNQTDPA
jgi:hypothetical protein